MDGVIVQKSNGDSININVIRYFQLNGFNYLIFSLNEIDDGGYVKLYISKIINSVGNSIVDDVEWNLVKDTIKDIIKRNKDGIFNGIYDLDESLLTNIVINDQKVFKLSDSLLQLLAANKNTTSFNDNILVEEKTNDILPNLESPRTYSNDSLESTEKNAYSQNNFEYNDKTNDSYMESQVPLVNDLNVYYEKENYDLNKPATDSVNYRSLYEIEHQKNEELLQELNKYQSLINDLKAVLK